MPASWIKAPKSLFLLTGSLALGIVGGLTAEYLAIPLPWLLGPLICCAIASTLGMPVREAKKTAAGFRTFLGVAIGVSFTPALFDRIGEMAISLSLLPLYVAALGLIGYPFFRKVCGFDKPTAYFSAMPGGLPDMLAFGAEARADLRMLSLVHATRVMLVVIVLPFVIGSVFDIDFGDSSAIGSHWNNISPIEMVLIVFCAFGGWFTAQKLGITGASIVGPMIFAAIASIAGFLHERPPVEVIIIAQLLIGISVGSKYAGVSRHILLHGMAAAGGYSILIMITGASFAALAAWIGDVGFLDAILAYTPGGQAEMTILAIFAGADAAFVALHHIIRVFLVVMGAPIMHRHLK
ncbi:AbrB family transcriptional regulator [Thalassospira sp.]|uniref:AbrB family transcriptional regulator n=1 Tax=Thalassospira sp. TaxID=1912094 RepID=UPI002733D1E2|nr:AbrB family transcriptional regulator [Thalassospira sp.]MDP2699140.1 AbrB family transcriptional regulator [Thalassospira sp.]